MSKVANNEILKGLSTPAPSVKLKTVLLGTDTKELLPLKTPLWPTVPDS